MSSMKFRRSCASCNATFFASDRKASYCPKCARKKPEPRPQPSRTITTTPTRPQAPRAHSTAPVAKAPSKPRPASSPAPRRNLRLPKITELTPDLRAKIEATYQSLKGSGDPLKKLHAQISQELWVKVKLVAEVVSQLRQQAAPKETCNLLEAERQQVIERYLKLIRENIRPQEGRRSVIARELNLPQREVVLAVREWSNEIMGQLNRIQLFTIEKEYWRVIENGNYKFVDLPKVISSRVGFATADQVARWLDQLHDDTKVARVSPPPQEKVDQIIMEYHRYLEQPTPPEHSLHNTLAKTLGVLPNQIHRVLCDYRCRRRPS
ncbi:MAG: hypothetical protein AB1489_22670 [Acidobacteriota bacterium]